MIHRSDLFSVGLISTGGTIEKTYDSMEEVLRNDVSVLDIMLASMTLNGVMVEKNVLMNIDSLEMTEKQHMQIVDKVTLCSSRKDGIIVVHGTGRLAHTGELIHTHIPDPRVPIVLTGAMKPYALRHTDAVQNLTEALLAVQLLQPGVYVALHNRVLKFPGVIKDIAQGTFRYRRETST